MKMNPKTYQFKIFNLVLFSKEILVLKIVLIFTFSDIFNWNKISSLGSYEWFLRMSVYSWPCWFWIQTFLWNFLPKKLHAFLTIFLQLTHSIQHHPTLYLAHSDLSVWLWRMLCNHETNGCFNKILYFKFISCNQITSYSTDFLISKEFKLEKLKSIQIMKMCKYQKFEFLY